MEQCQGKTKSGARCKRSVSADFPFCSYHADQVGGHAPESESGDDTEKCDSIDTLVVAAALGAAVIVVVAVGKLFRL